MQIRSDLLLPLIRIDQHRRLDFLDFSGKPLTWFVIGLILHTIGLIYVHFSPDSMHYVDIGRNLARGLGLVTFNLNLTSESIPTAVSFWPPLYPVLLSIGFKLGMGAAGAARVISLVSFAIIFFSVYAIGRNLGSHAVGMLAIMVWLILVSRWLVSLYAWSEPLFIAICCLALLVMMKSLQKEEHLVYYFALAGLLCGLATSTRFIGVALLPCGILAAILNTSRSGNNHRRLWCIVKLTSVLMLSFLAVVSVWLIYSMVVSGYLTSPVKAPSQMNLEANIVAVGKRLILDLYPIFTLMLLLCLLAGLFPVRRFLSHLCRKSGVRNVLLLVSCWVMSYCSLLVVLASIYDLRPLDTRLLSPVYPFLILGLSVVIYSVYLLKFDVSRIPRLVYLAFFLAAMLLAVKHLFWEIEISKSQNYENYRLYNWIRTETGPDDLFVGYEAWHICFYTGRPVLESGYPGMPRLTPEAVTAFLKRFEADYNNAYYVLIMEKGERFSPKDLRLYNRAGFDLRPCGVFDSYLKEVEVYRILRCDQEITSSSY